MSFTSATYNVHLCDLQVPNTGWTLTGATGRCHLRVWRTGASCPTAHSPTTHTSASYFPSSSSMCTVRRDRRSTSSDGVMPSGRRRGMAATQVRNRSIRGFLSPLQGKGLHTSDTPSWRGKGYTHNPALTCSINTMIQTYRGQSA